MKLEFLSFDFEKFAQEMQDLKDKKGFDYLVTIVGEDFGGEEGLGCVYILENTTTHERCSVKMLAKTQVCGDGMSSNGSCDLEGQMLAYIPTVSDIWKVADLLEREVYDFYGIVFLGHKDMRRLFLRSDFKGYPFRKDWQFNDSAATLRVIDSARTGSLMMPIPWRMTWSLTTVWSIIWTRTATCSQSRTNSLVLMTM